MKIIISLLILISTSLMVGKAQTLTGHVYDNKTKKPINEAYVYLDGTAIHTTTDINGYFELIADKIINTKLVINHIAYEVALIENPFEKTPPKIYLKEQANVLNEVIIQADRFTRKQKMNAFREQFLGNTKAGKSCIILNEDDVQVYYNEETQTLSASANKPILINNNYLGYKLLFELIEFTVQYNNKTLDNESVKQSFFLGTSSFIDLNSNNSKIKKRRDDVYKTSSTYFFKNLANQTLKESNYLVFNKSYQVNPYMFFTIKDTLSFKQVEVDPDSGIDRFVLGYKQPVFGKISTLYDKKIQSSVIFLTNKIWVDNYGNITPVDKVIFSGHMADQRVGAMLPIDYELKDEK